MIARLRAQLDELRGGLDRFDARVTVIMTVAAVMLLVFRKLGSSGTFEGQLAPEALRGHPRLSVLGDYYWFLSCFVMLGVVPFVTLRLLERGPLDRERYGLGLGDWRAGLKWLGVLLGVMLPIVFVVSRDPAFYRYYPLNGQLGDQAVTALRGQGPADFFVWFAVYELLYVVYFVGWEYFFRGFLQFGLWPRWGFDTILVANIPFALMHAGKPLPEALGSIVAGFALGLLVWRTRSFWWAFVLHAVIAVSMDGFAILARLSAAP